MNPDTTRTVYLTARVDTLLGPASLRITLEGPGGALASWTLSEAERVALAALAAAPPRQQSVLKLTPTAAQLAWSPAR
jgi:hypothetical protein